jgi:hypothetical protein
VSNWSGAWSAVAIVIRRNVSNARFILVALIFASPARLLWDGPIVQGIVAGILAPALVIIARSLRPGETAFLVSIIRPPAIVAAIPALWVIVQVLPLGVFAHPIWKSAEAALKHPIAGTISVDPGASVVAFGQYLSLTAVTFLSAAVAVDRQRAEWILFALTGAVTLIALIAMLHDLLFPGTLLPAFVRAQAVDCAGIGTIIAGAACIRTIERYETRHSSPQRSLPALRLTFVACSVALAICGAVLIVRATPEVLFATGYGLLALVCMMIIRRFRLGLWLAAGIAASALGVATMLAAAHLEKRASVTLVFAAAPSASLPALSERVLDDAPLVGTGAATFAAVAPIYREIDDPPPGSVAATAAATFAIELGAPMLWLTVAATVAFIITLLRASLQRGRDSFYPAMGGGCLITLLLLAFTNAGLLGAVTGLIVAATLGLAFAQSQSRTLKLGRSAS